MFWERTDSISKWLVIKSGFVTEQNALTWTGPRSLEINLTPVARTLPKGEGLSVESARSPTFGRIPLHQRGGLWFGLPQGEAGFYRAADGRLKRVLVFDLLTKKDTLPRYTDPLSREGFKCVPRKINLTPVARSPTFGETSPPQRGGSYKWRLLRKRARDDGN